MNLRYLKMKCFCFLFLSFYFIRCEFNVTYPNGVVTFTYKNRDEFMVTLRGKLGTWVGIGYNTTMINTDMNIAEFHNSTSYKLYDSYSRRRGRPSEDTSLGGSFDFKNITYTSDSEGNGILSFTRSLNTGDIYDAVLDIDKQLPLIYAFGPGSIGYHGGKIGTANFLISNNSTHVEPTNDTYTFWKFHAISLTILWSVFNYIGYLFARFYKHLSWWIWLHRIGAGIPAFYSIGLLGASIKFANPISEESPSVVKLHVYLGITFFSIIVIQTLLGIIGYYLIYTRKSFNSDFAHKFKWLHKIIGMLLTFTTYGSIISGYYFFWNELVVIPAVLCGFFLGLILVSEILNLIHNRITKTTIIEEFINEINSFLQELPAYDLARVDLEKNNCKFVIYDNYLINVTKFNNHPGGQMMIEENLYNEVGRYVSGTQAYSKNFKSHSHQQMTQKFILEKLAYAQIRDNNRIVFYQNKGESSIMQYFNIKSNDYFDEPNTTLIGRNEIADGIYEYRFSSKKGLQFSKLLPGVFWIGRHFRVSSKALNKTRYYSLCVTLHPNIKEKHLHLLENISRLERGEELENLLLSHEELKSDYLSLYIKNYNFQNCLSNHLTKLRIDEDSDLHIRGPNGVGLNLFKEKLSGTHVIFAAGTGIIPFLDMVSFTLRYAAYKVGLSKYNNNSNVLLEHENESFEKLVGPDYQLLFYATFSSSKTAFFLDICKELQKFDEKYSLNIFKFHCRFADENKERWNEGFIRNQLNEYAANISQVYLVGSVGFMDDIKNDLIKSGCVEKNKIFLV